MESQKLELSNSLRRMKAVARTHGLTPWIFDTRKTLRRRAWCHLYAAPIGTRQGIEDSVFAMCFGLRFAIVEEAGPGKVKIRLRHTLLGLLWRRPNIRKVKESLRRIVPATCAATVS